MFEAQRIIGGHVRASRLQAACERRDTVTVAVAARGAADGIQGVQDAAHAATVAALGAVVDRGQFLMSTARTVVAGAVADAVAARLADAEEALSVASDATGGLDASVVWCDPAQGRAFARRVDCGVGHVNGSIVHDDPARPFGGHDAIHGFTERHWIALHGGSGTDAGRGGAPGANQGEERP